MVESFFILPKDVVLVSANNIYGKLKTPHEIMDHREMSAKEATHSEHPNYSCFMVKRDFFEKVGSFVENFVMG
jgi:hypothetical protein